MLRMKVSREFFDAEIFVIYSQNKYLASYCSSSQEKF